MNEPEWSQCPCGEWFIVEEPGDSPPASLFPLCESCRFWAKHGPVIHSEPLVRREVRP